MYTPVIVSEDQAQAWADKAARDAKDYDAKAEILSNATLEGASGMLLAQEFRSAAHHLREFAKKIVRKK